MDISLLVVRIYVRDWDRAIAFYTEVFGREPAYRDENYGWAQFTYDGFDFGIERDAENRSGLVGRDLGLSLWIGDVYGAYESLARRGVIFLGMPEPQHWGGVLARFQDPDGNVLALAGQPPRASASSSHR